VSCFCCRPQWRKSQRCPPGSRRTPRPSRRSPQASASYKIDDRWIAEIGGNLFFGQFERDNNIYASLRYGF